MRKSGSLSMVTCVFFMGLSTGCLERAGAPIGPEIGFGQEVVINPRGVTAVDLLFVIDDSGSMREEQRNLAVQLPQLVRDLASPPDRDDDGAPDWPAVESLRIAIANTDVGTGSVMYQGAQCVPGGDDGMLHGAGIYEWEAGDDPDAFAADVRTVVENIGVTGCAFEQQLEATVRALERAGAQGFPREDALLAIIVVTDEEDCSVDDDDAFFSNVETGAPNVHCTRNAHFLTAVSTLADRIRGDREPEDVVFAAIAGIPPGLPEGTTPAEINAHADMQYREVVFGTSVEPQPACEFIQANGESLGKASPARRIVSMAEHFPGAVLHSICTDDFGPAIAEIAASVGERVPGVCLARAVPDALPGEVPCTIEVTLPEGEACASWPGYNAIGLSAEGREVCAIAQVVAGSGEDGWYYEPADATCPRVAMTERAIPPLGADIAAECFFSVQLDLGEQCARASQCESGYCDPVDRTCAPLPETAGESDPPTGG